jgi:hypothetical protein
VRPDRAYWECIVNGFADTEISCTDTLRLCSKGSHVWGVLGTWRDYMPCAVKPKGVTNQ